MIEVLTDQLVNWQTESFGAHTINSKHFPIQGQENRSVGWCIDEGFYFLFKHNSVRLSESYN